MYQQSFFACGFKTSLSRAPCRRRRETDLLFLAVVADNLDQFKQLVKEGHEVNTRNSKGASLLNFVMRRKRVAIFDYLMSLEKIDVNILDRLNQSPLVYLSGVCFDEYFAMELIKKGADVHMTDDSGLNVLHLTANSDADNTSSFGQFMIEKGVNINGQSKFGLTPLYAACEAGNFEWVCMLIFYGADVTIASMRGLLPLVVISQDIPPENLQHLQEVLFYCTFDNDKVTITLPNLVSAMTQQTDLFPKILEGIDDVEYDVLDLKYFLSSLINIKPNHLKLFVEIYGDIVKDLCSSYAIFDGLLKLSSDYMQTSLRELIEIFLYSDYAFEFVQSCDPKNNTIADLIDALIVNETPSVSFDELSEFIYIMLSNGLTINSADLDVVYLCFGYCELFRILLYMDVNLSNDRTLASMYYNPYFEVDKILGHSHYQKLLEYFNSYVIKKSVKASDPLKIKVKEMPTVSSLLELSRDAARKFILCKFNVKNSCQFYTILKSLPIGEMNKRIIALEATLY